MPTAVGTAWTYELRDASGIARVVKIRVKGPARVGLVTGIETEGDGICRFAWTGGTLICSQAGSYRFDPPITFLKPNAPTSIWSWKGHTLIAGTGSASRASCAQREERISVAGQQRQTLMVEIELSTSSRQDRLVTWFEEGVGIVRQEQYSHEQRVAVLEWIGGG